MAAEIGVPRLSSRTRRCEGRRAVRRAGFAGVILRSRRWQSRAERSQFEDTPPGNPMVGRTALRLPSRCWHQWRSTGSNAHSHPHNTHALVSRDFPYFLSSFFSNSLIMKSNPIVNMHTAKEMKINSFGQNKTNKRATQSKLSTKIRLRSRPPKSGKGASIDNARPITKAFMSVKVKSLKGTESTSMIMAHHKNADATRRTIPAE